MKFRLKAFGLHLLASAGALWLVLGALYFGWYRWPGWYVADVSSVAAVLIGVDLTVGPLFTFIVARSDKARSELARDISIIAFVQLCALMYGAASLWSGRPLYYAFSENVLQLVQAYDISGPELAVAREKKLELRPHWYSLPQWIWAPLPADPKEREQIAMAAISGGDDVIDMPRYFKRWEQGLPALRKQLKKADDVPYFSRGEKNAIKERMRTLGLDINQPNAIPLTGRGKPLLVVFDPARLTIVAILEAPQAQRPDLYRSIVQRYLKKIGPANHRATSHL